LGSETATNAVWDILRRICSVGRLATEILRPPEQSLYSKLILAVAAAAATAAAALAVAAVAVAATSE